MTSTHPRRPRARRRGALVGGLVLAAIAVPLPAHAAPSAAAATVDALPSVGIGAEITVTVAVTGVVDLYAYDMAVRYDPDLVAFVSGSVVTPDGGFADESDDGAGTVVVRHTRLGSSPGLEDDVTLAMLTFTAVAGGEAAFVLPTATLVGADLETALLTDAASATTTIAPAASPTSPPAGAEPAPRPTADPTGPRGGVGASGGASGADSTGALALTGAGIAGLVGAALLAVTVGVLLARRRAVASR